MYLSERVPEVEARAAAECLAAALHYQLIRLGLPVASATLLVKATIHDGRVSARKPKQESRP